MRRLVSMDDAPYMYECEAPHLGLLRLRARAEFSQPLASDVSMSPRNLTLESKQYAEHSLFHSRNALGFTSNPTCIECVKESNLHYSKHSSLNPQYTITHIRELRPQHKFEFHLIQTTRNIISYTSQTNLMSVVVTQGSLPPKTFLPIYCFQSRTMAKFRLSKC